MWKILLPIIGGALLSVLGGIFSNWKLTGKISITTPALKKAAFELLQKLAEEGIKWLEENKESGQKKLTDVVVYIKKYIPDWIDWIVPDDILLRIAKLAWDKWGTCLNAQTMAVAGADAAAIAEKVTKLLNEGKEDADAVFAAFSELSVENKKK
ncbi:MAG: hypothetical protein LBQ97_02705 [Fusobacteriaceae bacterium]|jgi:hypothetical protein|nr:hypothetical protein [Fusobacteriaceae bacterium]